MRGWACRKETQADGSTKPCPMRLSGNIWVLLPAKWKCKFAACNFGKEWSNNKLYIATCLRLSSAIFHANGCRHGWCSCYKTCLRYRTSLTQLTSHKLWMANRCGFSFLKLQLISCILTSPSFDADSSAPTFRPQAWNCQRPKLKRQQTWRKLGCQLKYPRRARSEATPGWG